MASRGLPLLALIPSASAFSHLSTGTLDPNNILCPVLGSLYNLGVLPVDSEGDAERADIKSALKEGTWCSEDFAEFQSGGIAAYDSTHKQDLVFRDRCLPGLTLSGTGCWNKWLIGSTAQDVKRYLPLFRMNALETVEHGMSTGVRGGNCNSPTQNDLCNGQYPCEALFQKYYVAAAKNGRIYNDQILDIICHAHAEGDRGGEFSYMDGDVTVLGLTVAKLPARTWQMKGAMQGWLAAFGRPDENNELYFTVDDARAMLMETRVPDGWEKRRWGCVTAVGGCPKMFNGKRDTPFLDQVNAKMPCDLAAPWWQGYSMPTTTGQTCKHDHNCDDPYALCLSKHCTCSKGSNGVQMLVRGGSCQESPEPPRHYNGQSCRPHKANNPDSPAWGSAHWLNLTAAVTV